MLLSNCSNTDGTIANTPLIKFWKTISPGYGFTIAIRSENFSDVVNMGDVFMIKHLGVDPKTRKEKVSKKALLTRPPRDENTPREDRGPRQENHDDRVPRR